MNPLLKGFKKALKELADELNVKPSQITAKDFKAGSDFTEWELRKLGGFNSAKDFLYPEAAVAGSGVMATKAKGAWLKGIVKKQVTDQYLKEEFLQSFKEVIEDQPLKIHSPTKLKKASKNKNRTIVVQVSDTHFGANIQASEMHGINEFNWTVASRRMALLAEQVVNYKPQYRKDSKLLIAINGDIIAGVIHDQEWFADLLAKQAAGTLKILIQFISFCAQHFEDVEVVMTSGNHGRSMHKGSKSRGTTHKWDSYETIIYSGVKYAVESKCKNVKCVIPETPYAVVDIQGHKFFQTHGDTVLNVGNPGSSINMRSINTQINKLNSSSLAQVHFAGIMVGHVHVQTVQLADNGTMLLINGTLSGADPYCQSIGIFSNEPTQMLFEVTKEHAVGDIRFIRLEDADGRSELDKIIEPLKGNLE
jgi:predicted MPP superfamily phosphohydrolase